MKLTPILIAAFLVLSEKLLIVTAAGGIMIANPDDATTKKMNPDSKCILDHFARSPARARSSTLDRLHREGKALVCLGTQADPTPRLAIAYDINEKIPVMAFKSYHCAGPDRCKLYENKRLEDPKFNDNDINGSPAVSKHDDIDGVVPTFYPGTKSALDFGYMDRGHLLSRKMGAGLAGTNSNAGIESTFNMVNVVPQFRRSNQNGAWWKLEQSAATIIQLCKGHFYLVTGVKDYLSKQYTCVGQTYTMKYKNGKETSRLNGCAVQDKPRKRPIDPPLSFPKKMWIAGCCKENVNAVKLYYGEVDNDFTGDLLSSGAMAQYAPGEYADGQALNYAAFNRKTNSLFQGTVCHKT